MIDLGYDFTFHRILRSCALATSNCSDSKLIDTIVVSAFDVAENQAPNPKSRIALISGLGAVVSRIHENGVRPHPLFLALSDVLTRNVDEKSFVAALYTLAPDKLSPTKTPFSEESVSFIAGHIARHAAAITAKPPQDTKEISRLVCAIEKGPV